MAVSGGGAAGGGYAGEQMWASLGYLSLTDGSSKAGTGFCGRGTTEADVEVSQTPPTAEEAGPVSVDEFASVDKEKLKMLHEAVSMCGALPSVFEKIAGLTDEEDIFIFARLLLRENSVCFLDKIRSIPLTETKYYVFLAHEWAVSNDMFKLVLCLDDFMIIRWSMEERLSLAKVILRYYPNLLGERFKSFYIDNPLLLHEDVLQKVKEQPDLFSVYLPLYTWLHESTKKEIFRLLGRYYLRNVLQLNITPKTRFEVASEFVETKPRFLAANINDFALAEEERVILAEALYKKNPVVYAVYFYLFELAEESEAGRLHRERTMALSREELAPYYRRITSGAVDKDLPRLSEKEIAVAGPIISDGLGDFFNLLAIAQSIQNRFPGQAVCMSIVVERDHFLASEGIFVVPPTMSLEVAFLPPGHIANKDFLLPQTKKRLKESAFVVHLHPRVKENLFPVAADLMLREPGSPRGRLGLGEIDMGLLLPHYREVPDSLSKVAHPWLKEVLSYAIARDNEIGRIYFSWVEEEEAKNVTAKTLRLMGRITRPDKDLFVICNKLVSASHHYMKGLAEDFGSIVFMQEAKEERVALPFSERSRVLYLVDPGRVPHADMMIINKQITCPLVGCTGDQSFAEVVALERPMIPFYQMRGHKMRLYKQYVAVANTLLGEEHPFSLFLSSHYGVPGERLMAHLNHSSCLSGAASVHAHIRDRFNATTQIPALIAEKLRS